MSTVKISQLPLLTSLDANTANSLFMGVDIPTGTTGKFTAHTLAQGLYSNEILNVGINPVVYQDVIGQFSGNSSTYLQVNLQNFDSTGSSDYVSSTSDSDNTNKYVDMGINGKDFNDPVYSSMKAYDAYVYSHGPAHYDYRGNLVIGTASSQANVVFIAGGTQSNNIVAKITANGLVLNTQSYIVFADGSVQSVAGAPVNYTQSAFDAANTASANTIVNQGVDLTQNTRIQSIETINTNQNTAISIIQGVDLTQNTNITFVDSKAQGAFDLANTTNTRQNISTVINGEQNNRIQQLEANSVTLFAFQTQTGVINREQNTSINFAWSNANTALAIANAALANTTVTLNGDLTTTGNIITEFVKATYNSLGDFSPLATFTASNNGVILLPSSPGYIVQITGKETVSPRVVIDALGVAAVPNFLTRHARGVANTPAPTQVNDVIGRYSSFGYGNTVFGSASDARIDINALENFTDAAHGTSVSIFTTPIGSNTAVRTINASIGNTSILSSNTYIAGNTTFNGVVNVTRSNLEANTPLMRITGSDDGNYFAPSNTYYMLQITGKSNNATRVVIDSFGQNTYPLISGRMARGTPTAPLAVANNDVLMRIVGNGYTGTQFTSSSPAKIDFVAAENYTDSSRGSIIQFWNTPVGSNNIQRIASFNANEVNFSGSIVPEKGLVYIPKTFSNAQTAITINFANDSVIRAQTATGLTVTLSNFVYGKMVEIWVTNTSGNGQNFTHGCSAINSTTNSTTVAIPATSSILARYMSFDGDLANTFVSVIHA